jgi:hypothetical protein
MVAKRLPVLPPPHKKRLRLEPKEMASSMLTEVCFSCAFQVSADSKKLPHPFATLFSAPHSSDGKSSRKKEMSWMFLLSVCYPPLSRQKSTTFKSELSHMTKGWNYDR